MMDDMILAIEGGYYLSESTTRRIVRDTGMKCISMNTLKLRLAHLRSCK